MKEVLVSRVTDPAACAAGTEEEGKGEPPPMGEEGLAEKVFTVRISVLIGKLWMLSMYERSDMIPPRLKRRFCIELIDTGWLSPLKKSVTSSTTPEESFPADFTSKAAAIGSRFELRTAL